MPSHQKLRYRCRAPSLTSLLSHKIISRLTTNSSVNIFKSNGSEIENVRWLNLRVENVVRTKLSNIQWKKFSFYVQNGVSSILFQYILVTGKRVFSGHSTIFTLEEHLWKYMEALLCSLPFEKLDLDGGILSSVN